MQFDYKGKHYQTLRASDLARDGMGLELLCDGETVAEVFYSDADGDFSISVFQKSLPLAVVQRLIAEGKNVLLPTK